MNGLVGSLHSPSACILLLLFVTASCDAVELRATKTGNLISTSTAHHQVGNAVVFHSHAASHLMFVLYSNLFSSVFYYLDFPPHS